MKKSNSLDILSDTFYVKKKGDGVSCEYAYLHLSEEGSHMFLLFFENKEVREPTIYKWFEDDMSIDENSRRFILEFIGEAYLSLYIKYKLEDRTDKPLWHHHAMNCDIPSGWWLIIERIKMNYK